MRHFAELLELIRSAANKAQPVDSGREFDLSTFYSSFRDLTPFEAAFIADSTKYYFALQWSEAGSTGADRKTCNKTMYERSSRYGIKFIARWSEAGIAGEVEYKDDDEH